MSQKLISTMLSGKVVYSDSAQISVVAVPIVLFLGALLIVS
jgi:hypothetical protein